MNRVLFLRGETINQQTPLRGVLEVCFPRNVLNLDPLMMLLVLQCDDVAIIKKVSTMT